MPILNAFNEDTTVFEHPGHNYPIDKYEDACAEVAKNYFSNVDYLFTHKENKLVDKYNTCNFGLNINQGNLLSVGCVYSF